MIFKCDHEHGGGRTTRCMHGCNDAWAPIGDPEPAAVAPPSAPPEPAFACLQCRTAFVTETEARKHRDTDLHTCVAWALIPSVRKAEILRAPECVRCSAAMTDGAQYCRDTDWTEPHMAAVSPPETTETTETTAPTAPDMTVANAVAEIVALFDELEGYDWTKAYEATKRIMAVVYGRPVSPVASSATPTPEPRMTCERPKVQLGGRTFFRGIFAPGEWSEEKDHGEGFRHAAAREWLDRIHEDGLALASSQQEVATLREAINTAIGHIGAMNDRPDRVQWDELEGIQDALFASLTTEPR